ncbi:6290_t:CDS:1 [Funneliformis caledonium]|uniref:6290_t:CDS:1 n=1 Tax=Funneliformis caledonium TaxID=1117310 RepID=A0A9N8WDL4_9GLOM|nr:6290_t:CDS:1 [Funneliformis caledonium]
MSKSGVFSFKKSTIEGRHVFKNQKDGVIIVMEKFLTSNIRVVFIKDENIIQPPSEYYYIYNFGDKKEVHRKFIFFNEIPCFLIGAADLHNYTIYYNDKRLLAFHSMMQFSVSKPKYLIGKKRDKHPEIFKKIKNLLPIDDEKEILNDENYEDKEIDDEELIKGEE